jgi:hypothetical protein
MRSLFLPVKDYGSDFPVFIQEILVKPDCSRSLSIKKFFHRIDAARMPHVFGDKLSAAFGTCPHEVIKVFKITDFMQSG